MTKQEQRDAREVKAMVRNIVALYLDAPEQTQRIGAEWYRAEHQRCLDRAVHWGLTVQQVACAAAAISPGMRWELVFAALAALRTDPTHRVSTYSREFVRRAIACLSPVCADPFAVISGPKVTAFARLLACPFGSDAVVIDGHAWNIAQGTAYRWRATQDYRPPAAAQVTARRYRVAAEAYRQAAAELDLYPHQVQAVTWVHWKNLLEGKS